MPSPRPALSPADARRLAADHGFVAPEATADELVGLELEWLTVSLSDPAHPAPVGAVEAAAADAGDLPGNSRITFEPGGQVELSTPPLPLAAASDALAADLDQLGRAFANHGIGLVAMGLEPGPRRTRAIRSPRYDAMEAYFDTLGTAGRTMMCSTAALQVNLGFGTTPETSWQAAHALGPMLSAAFANSPFDEGRPSGWRSTRLAVWDALDATRTAPVVNGAHYSDAWASYVLDAPVMLVRVSDTEHVPLLEPLPFGTWLEGGHALGWPTADDLAYHLTTLFPPVRPRGWLELRMIDALPTPWWRVAAAVSTALVQRWSHEPRLAEAVAPTADCWRTSARVALSDERLATAAHTCFAIALEFLPEVGADTDTIAATQAYFDRYVAQRRCPADDLLDAWHSGGTLLPPFENESELVWR